MASSSSAAGAAAALARLVDRTRVPDPSLQRHAVAAFFRHLLSEAPPFPTAAHDALSSLLGSSHPAFAAHASASVACLAASRSDFLSPDLAFPLLIIAPLSAFPSPRLASCFVKAVAALVCCVLRSGPAVSRFPPHDHPFVQALASGADGAHVELPRQAARMVAERVVGFLRPFVLFAVVRKGDTAFVKDLIGALAAATAKPDSAVPACSERRNSVVQALGLESLSYLCETDVVDFYTAWKAMSKQLLDYLTDPTVSLGLCILLRWGAMNAEAYAGISKNLIQTLWSIETYTEKNADPLCFSCLVTLQGKSAHRQLPGEALLTLNFTPKDILHEGKSKDLPRVHAAYEQALVEMAESMHISRNMVVALAWHSWKSFVSHWMQAVIACLDTNESSKLNKVSKAASDVFKLSGGMSLLRLCFVGLLCGSCCIYMPLLIVNPTNVLSDLPVTLPSFLSSSIWDDLRNSVADKLWLLTTCFYAWAEQQTHGVDLTSHDHIHGSEAEKAIFLANMLRSTCIAVEDHLAVEKKLKLAYLEGIGRHVFAFILLMFSHIDLCLKLLLVVPTDDVAMPFFCT
ncbi:hypothetical protein ABZP36_016867 [Zizania latifolia]